MIAYVDIDIKRKLKGAYISARVLNIVISAIRDRSTGGKMKVLRTICVLAIALCLATSVYAGTQSVKISGDLSVRSITRGNYDLDHHHGEAAEYTAPAAGDLARALNAAETSDFQNYFMTTTELQIDADLTDNVSTVIRLYNQRDWNVRTQAAADFATDQDNVILSNLHTGNAEEFDVGVDLAYIELKEFLYSPLTLKIGRQDIWFGKGFIVGANLQDPQGTINANEYTAVSSFDALRATLDYDPWTIDAILALIWENDIGSQDDQTLTGINVGYVFDSYNAEAEAYWFHKMDKSTVPPRLIKEHNTVHTIGVRGSADPIENWTLAAETAFQFGDFVGFRDQVDTRGRMAYAFDVSGECRYFKEHFAWKPIVGAEYILYSGDNEERPTRYTNGMYRGWDPMYRGKFDTAYREFVGQYNFTAQGLRGMQPDYIDTFQDASYTNQHQVLAYGSLMPTDSLRVDGKVAFFWQQYARSMESTALEQLPAGELSKQNLFLGTEIDLQLTWDYTEDVSFGLLAAWYIPGNFYDDRNDDTATDLVGTVKLSF